MRIINFKDKDKMIAFQYRETLYSRIQEYGYLYISHFCHEIYYTKMKSSNCIAELLDVTPQCVTKWMRKWGFVLRKTGGKGAKD